MTVTLSDKTSETILSDNGNEIIMNKIDSLENKIKQITDINQQFQIEIPYSLQISPAFNFRPQGGAKIKGSELNGQGGGGRKL